MATHCKICSTRLTGTQRKFCSRKCINKDTNHRLNNYKAQQLRGKDRKLRLMKLLGGKCALCGYSKNSAALEFHHINPRKKLFGIDLRRCSNNKWTILVKEVRKCQLLCANCHAEVEHPNSTIESVALTS